MSLEDRVRAIEERLNMGSGLRAAGDRDLSDLGASVRAQHHLVQALSIAQGQHTEALRQLGESVGQIKREHGAKLDQIVQLLGQSIDRENGNDTAR
jgi:uncharacterized protein YegL